MGVDIHMHIISKEGKMKIENIFDGRDSEWFDNISGGDYHSEFYQNFPVRYGIPEAAPDSIKKDFDNKDEYCYYDFRYVNVGEFMDWFEETRPDIDAGWISTYDKWLYEKKKIVPRDLPHWLDEDCNPYDYHFIEVENPWDCSKWLYEYIDDRKTSIDPNDFIVYYFDC
jgi:hypothetical protein